jgi:hypothetical protein
MGRILHPVYVFISVALYDYGLGVGNARLIRSVLVSSGPSIFFSQFTGTPRKQETIFRLILFFCGIFVEGQNFSETVDVYKKEF